MDWGATNDPITNTSDVFVLPEYNDTGIYLLEDAGQVGIIDPHVGMDVDPYQRRATVERNLSDVRMRGGLKDEPVRERFGQPVYGALGERITGTPSFREYQRTIPGQQLLKSRRRGYQTIEEIGWDNRPPGFRPDDGPRASAFVPPPSVRPPRGGIITPWETSYAPTYSEAVIKRDVADPNMVGLAPCGALPQKREGFTANGGGALSAETVMVGLQMVKVVLFIIVVTLLAMWVVTSASEKRLGQQVRAAIQEALAELKARP